MKTLVLGMVDNYDYHQIEPWLVSLQRSGYGGDIGLICYNIKKDVLKKLCDKGVKLFCVRFHEVSGDAYYPIKDIMVSRFFNAYKIIESHKDYDYIVFTDVRDVLFQGNPVLNPFEYVPDLMVGSENITYELEAWNKNNMLLSFGQDLFEIMKKRIVNCAGVIAGNRQSLSSLFFNLYLICKSLPYHVEGGGGPDQAALNLLLTQYPYDEQVGVYNGDNDWVCHAGTTNHAIFDGVRENHMSYFFKNSPELYEELSHIPGRKSPILKDGLVCNHEGRPYKILHQYDRIESWKDLKEKYRE